METYSNETFDEERALYGSTGLLVDRCRFEGPADGESAMKESRDVTVKDSYFDLRYPFWHDTHVVITDSLMTEHCRAALWYSKDVRMERTKAYGIKALRECENIEIRDCDICSPEFGWFNDNVRMKDTTAESEYFMMRSKKLYFENVKMRGKYSFQYIEDSEFVKCTFDTKDAFWHAKNVVVRDSLVKGEYLAWYCENVTFINCTIVGTQPLCYCKGLKLVDCKMIDADLAFEKSEVDATIIGSVLSIKNPKSGEIRLSHADELIMDDPDAKAVILFDEPEERQKCPCCGYYTLLGSEEDTAYEICPVCYWENDISGEYETSYSGANDMTLAEGRANYERYGACDPRFVKKCRSPKKEEQKDA